MIGHSQGEIAAAHISGALSLDDAARVIALRAKAMRKIAGKGGMLSLSLTPAAAKELLEPYGERLSLAAINGPASLVLSGETKALDELLAACEKDGTRAQRIAVDYAAHSAQIEALEEELLEAFAPISPQSSEIPLHSTLTGEPIDTAEMDAAYWYRNLRQTVLFEPALRALLSQGQRAFIEIGPHPVLGFGAIETIEDALPDPTQASVIGTLRRKEDGPERFALSLAEAHVAGAKLDWDAFFKGSAPKAVPLPTYPFQRQRYWLNASVGAGDIGAAGQLDADHPLLSAAVEVAGGDGEELLLTGRISLTSHPWLADHAVAGAVLLPGTAFLELALRAAEQVGAKTVSELTLQAPLILAEQGAVQLQVSVSAPNEQGQRELSIHSRPEGQEEELGQSSEWTENASGLLSAEASASPEPLDQWPPEGAEPIALDDFYAHLEDLGLEYGPAFQGLSAAWKQGEEIYAEASLPEDQAGAARRFGLHPALLDAALHAIALTGTSQELSLPFAWSDVCLLADGPSELRVALSPSKEGVSLNLSDSQGSPVAAVGSLVPARGRSLPAEGRPKGPGALGDRLARGLSAGRRRTSRAL